MKINALRHSRVRLAAAIFLAVPLYLSAAPATVTHVPWGKDPAGAPVELYTIVSGNAELKVTDYGARVVSLRVPNGRGAVGNVIVGPDSLDGFMTDRTAVNGATIGRYANRIAGGQFTLNGITYTIPKNNGPNALHGGPVGFNHKVWKASAVKDGVGMTLVSPDGDMGFPGTLTVHVTFTLKQDHGSTALRIQYTAETNKVMVINLTNHAYFNLADDPTTPVLQEGARIYADTYTPVAAGGGGIPTGAIDPVAGTPFDFRAMHAIGENAPQRGYDNNFVLRAHAEDHAVAEVDDAQSGRTLKVYTTEPGIQFFVPLFPAPPPAADGARRPSPPSTFCLETQHFPDAPNHPQFPSTVLLPGKQFRSTTAYVFGVARR
jgi:aldose 1-epimerase